jgi:hypothetical protein
MKISGGRTGPSSGRPGGVPQADRSAVNSGDVIRARYGQSYTDRFESLLWTHTDWHHHLEPHHEGGYDVSWRLEARGPLSLISLPVLESIFGEEVSTAVDDFVELAEARS